MNEGLQSMTWVSHPLRDEPVVKSAALVVIILGVSLIVGVSFQSGAFAFVALALLVVAMARYFFATRYVLDETGVVISHLGVSRDYAWTNFHRVARHPNGIFLSALPSRIASTPFAGNSCVRKIPVRFTMWPNDTSLARLKKYCAHAFAVSPPESAIGEDDEALAEKVAAFIVGRKLTAPAIMALKPGGP